MILASWQNFYLLVGEASATLIGLMFVAITFGASLITEETSASARSFIDPTFTHFVHVLVTACLMVIPNMSTTALGVLFALLALVRASALIRIFRHMREAQAKHNDIELSDWLSNIVVPSACYLTLAAAGVAFVVGHPIAFALLAAVTIAIMLNGVFGAWELMVSMAVTRSRRK